MNNSGMTTEYPGVTIYEHTDLFKDEFGFEKYLEIAKKKQGTLDYLVSYCRSHKILGPSKF